MVIKITFNSHFTHSVIDDSIYYDCCFFPYGIFVRFKLKIIRNIYQN
jgi:hypothetical protein